MKIPPEARHQAIDGTAAVHMDAVDFRYKKAWVLKNCSISIPAGRLVGLVGANGVGKTTLLKLITGLAEPHAGTIAVFGSPVRQASESLSRTSFLAQSKPLFDSFTVSEMLKFGRLTNVRWDQPGAETRLHSLGIDLRAKVRELSGGQRSQVALAIALAKEPKLLVLDEPMADLDPIARREMIKAVSFESHSRGTTVLISSHIISDISNGCDWLVIMNRYGPALSGGIDEIRNRHMRISGPSSDLSHLYLDPTIAIIEEHNDADGRTTLLVRLDGVDREAIASTLKREGRWTFLPLDLEEISLAYITRPAGRSVDLIGA